MSRPRATLVLDVIIGLLVLLVLLTAVAAAAARSYPTAFRRILLPLVIRDPRVLSYTQDAKGFTDAIAVRAADGFAYRVSGPAQRILGSRPESATPAVESPTLASPVSDADCVSCHPDYATDVRFSVVYFSHDTHSGGDFGCVRCHDGLGPNRDAVPSMDGCSACHTETAESEGCVTCHPPGSLFHGATMAADRELSQECAVCHPNGKPQPRPRSHEMPAFDLDKASCARCHDDGFCKSCHPPSHGAGYAAKHPAQLGGGMRPLSGCWSCHDARWCGTTCHADSSRRRGVQR